MNAMANQRLAGKVAFITGGASGVGKATALRLAGEGANVVVSDVNEEGGRAVAAEIGAQSCFVQHDVTDEAQWSVAIAAAQARFGALDVLVNNAGIGYVGAFLDTPLEVWKRVLNINVMGAVHGCMHFLPRMQQAGGVRRIVNVASLAGVAPAPNMSAYAASKHAIMGFTEGLALELRLAGSSVEVTTVCPGIINTDITKPADAMSASIGAAQQDKLKSYYEAQGVGPEVVAAAIVDAVRRGRSLVLVGPFARPMYHLRRLSRKLAQWLMLNDARKAGYS